MALGCSTDERLVAHMELADERQAAQNREIARQNQELAQATNHFLSAEAQARGDSIALQRQFQLQQQDTHEERDRLEAERRQWAVSRQRESLLAPLLIDLGLLLACLAPLGLCWYLLYLLRYERRDAGLSELFATELLREASPRLSGEDASDSSLLPAPARTRPR